jgi:hypothetical protein
MKTWTTGFDRVKILLKISDHRQNMVSASFEGPCSTPGYAGGR